MLEKLPEGVGHALNKRRAGLEKTAFNAIEPRAGKATIALRSPAFADHAAVPSQYTADGVGISPPLEWSGIPSEASSVVLIVEDADAPTPQPLVHAIVVDLAPRDSSLAEGALKSPHHEGMGTKVGRNSYFKASWLPPDPPPGHGPHRYAFQLFALAEGPAFPATPGRGAVLEVLRKRALASGLLIGTYERG